jgi:hypothetical protein
MSALLTEKYPHLARLRAEAETA